MDLFEINPREVAEKLITFLKENLERVGRNGFVLGLSGGLDSSVCAALAVEAIGAGKINALMMPYATSSSASISDAEMLAEKLKIKVTKIDITPIVEPYFKLETDINYLRKGNFMARIRMALLYDHAARTRSLVLGTSNKSEALLGYGTLHGDVAWDINPLWDLYKTQVRTLAEYLEIPQAIIHKKPTADLWQGQTDENELGFTYERVDKLLFLALDKALRDPEIETEGFSMEEINRAKRLVKANQFKRSGPIVARIFPEYPGCDFIAPDSW
ncbi:MAG: NAD+ synthase [candidate division Zixibacteria bacterium]|nr:NAD+ synthase [candidate division Zixibacteria bacterium]